MPSPWPTSVLAVGVLIWSHGADRLLLVQTHHADRPSLPGGLVETGESLSAAALREVKEEVGLTVELGPVLAVQHTPIPEQALSSVQFVFDSSPLPSDPDLRLQDAEIADAFWVDPHEATRRLSRVGSARLVAALAARASGQGLPALEWQG